MRKREAQKKKLHSILNFIKEEVIMLFNNYNDCNNNHRDCGCGFGDNNCLWIILLLLCNCGGGINGCIDICSLIFLLLILSMCDNNNSCK